MGKGSELKLKKDEEIGTSLWRIGPFGLLLQLHGRWAWNHGYCDTAATRASRIWNGALLQYLCDTQCNMG